MIRNSEWYSWDDGKAVYEGDWNDLSEFLLDDGEFPAGAKVTITNKTWED